MLLKTVFLLVTLPVTSAPHTPSSIERCSSISQLSAPRASASRSSHDQTELRRHTEDADQRFLHAMLDVHAALRALAHIAMTRQSEFILPMQNAMRGHGMSVGPAAAADSRADADTEEMRALLKLIYAERYEPRMRARDGAAVDSLTSVADSARDSLIRRGFVRLNQDGITLIDAYAGQLRRGAVQTLARDMRARHLLEAGRADREPAIDSGP